MITLKEIMEAEDRILFITPKPVKRISVGVDLYASPVSIMLSFDGETFDEEELRIDRGKRLEFVAAVKAIAIRVHDNRIFSGMVSFGY